MAERRMFAKTIIDSDAFLDMPPTTQLLYFHLSMRADDDGFVNKPKSVMRMIGATQGDIEMLIIKKFIIPFESGIVVIKHWKIHNYIRNDRYTETKYKEEKALLMLDENNAGDSLGTQDTDTPGEAVLTGSTGFAAQAKVSREQVRSQNKADLQDIINNSEIDDEEKQEAIHTMVSMTDLTEKEAAAELLLEAKGFQDVVVNLTGETADVVVPDAELSDAQRAQIEDIVKRKTGIAAENIVITPLKESQTAEEETQDTAAQTETDGDTADTETAAQPYEDTTVDTTDIYD